MKRADPVTKKCPEGLIGCATPRVSSVANLWCVESEELCPVTDLKFISSRDLVLNDYTEVEFGNEVSIVFGKSRVDKMPLSETFTGMQPCKVAKESSSSPN